MKNEDKQIIFFTRFAVAGYAKTRLIPSLGAEGAAQLQRQMTEFTLNEALKTKIPVVIYYTGGTKEEMQNWLGKEHEYIEQAEGDLGQKMSTAFERAFASAKKNVVIIGADCPYNRCDNILKAFELLSYNSCVFGPASDGGYYLLGLNKQTPELFSDIAWGSSTVLAQSLDKINNYILLTELPDVDEIEDVPAKISVIIVNYNECEMLKNTIEQAQKGFNIEIIVADGQSTDKSQEIANSLGVKFIISQKGRATQMNRASKEASGDILLFLHADSELLPYFDLAIRNTLKKENVKLGFFDFAVSGDFNGKGFLKDGTNLRAKFFKMPYGDQALFLTKDTFDEIGGYRNVPLLEDVFLVKDAKKLGNISSTNLELVTSGRRWIKHGFWKTFLINQAVMFAAWRGADLNELNKAYRNGANPLSILFIKGSK